MKRSIEPLVAAVALTLASTAALSQVQPNPQPAHLTIAPGAQSVFAGDGALILTVWSQNRSLSLWLSGYTYSDLLIGGPMTELGTFLDFGTIPGFDVFAGDTAPINWTVSSGSANGFTAEVLLTTMASTSVPTAIRNGAINASLAMYGNFETGVWANPAICGNVNPCVADENTDPYYLGQPSVGLASTSLGRDPDLDNGALLGTSMSFYRLEDTGSSTANSKSVTRYSHVGSVFGEWLLQTNGRLTYSLVAVPLPAAAWLFVSGLLGLGTIARRRAKV